MSERRRTAPDSSPRRVDADAHDGPDADAQEGLDTERREEAARRAAARSRRLAEVFGEVLPETTGDERSGPQASNDERLRRDVPPHHT